MSSLAQPTLIPHWVGGRPLQDAGARSSPVTNPATGRESGRVSLASAAAVDAAVAAAEDAQPTWAAQAPLARARVLFEFLRIAQDRTDELVEAITAEHGKVHDDARGEVSRGLEVVEFACGVPHLLKGEYSDAVSSSADSYSLRQPIGVVAGITPFNFPAMVPMWMYPLALACGNAFLLKPSEKTPTAANLVAEMLTEAGLPDGVFNVVHGDKEAVDAILDHQGIRAVSFVGSTPIARYVYERAAVSGKRVQALGGAKNHAIVLPDADLDLAADGIVSAGYGSAGERCMAISVVVAVGDIGDPLVEAVRQRTLEVRTRPGDEPGAEMGALVTAAHRDRVKRYIDEGVAAGAEIVVDGRDHVAEGHEGGFWVGPTLFDRVDPSMSIYTDEIFGPVLVVLRAPSYQAAVDLVNANPYANGASIFTNDGGAARRFQREVDAGMVGINVPIPVPMAFHSFGGFKQSLFGDLHVHGPDGVRFYTRGKVVTSRWPAPEHRGIDLGFPS
jgi:malonate-semialdehyde dehydrogenase (acetylating)/methylmalonate-semialdehyde dehydrogenase